MRKTAFCICLLFFLGLIPLQSMAVLDKDDIRIIKKAVKENPASKKNGDVKWFKVLVRDTKTKKDKVKITLPVKMIEIFLDSHKNLKLEHDDLDVDFHELFKELKKMGPMALIEVEEDDAIIKVWLE